ncbi:MAG: biotin/lipoyl-containing protein [Bradyrhizobium sp.]
MQTNITVPTNIKSQMKLSIGRWFKKVGDSVTLDEPLVEIDTDNVTHELRATATGVLSQVLVKDGASVEPNAVLGIIAEY